MHAEHTKRVINDHLVVVAILFATLVSGITLLIATIVADGSSGLGTTIAQQESASAPMVETVSDSAVVGIAEWRRLGNLADFEMSERAPGLHTGSEPITVASEPAQGGTVGLIRMGHLAKFELMERSPGAFTGRHAFVAPSDARGFSGEVGESALTHPWGGDSLYPDY